MSLVRTIDDYKQYLHKGLNADGKQVAAFESNEGDFTKVKKKFDDEQKNLWKGLTVETEDVSAWITNAKAVEALQVRYNQLLQNKDVLEAEIARLELLVK